MNNFYAVFMHFIVVYAQNIHVLSDYFGTYIGDILQKHYERIRKITGNSIVYWSYTELDRNPCICSTSITIR
jgi:hypothetical protein